MDLNADLGEGGPTDPELLEVVTSASVACGSHAGDPETMLRTARMAAARDVAIGAHPSYPDREGFGRRPMGLGEETLYAEVLVQVAAMAAVARAAGSSLAYVKPHGALYNQAAVEAAVATPVIRAVSVSGVPLLCPPGSEMERLAGSAGVTVYTEAFADRMYEPDGTLTPRSVPGSVIEDPAEVADRAVRMAVEGLVAARDGSLLAVAPDSICLHGDTPGALDRARRVRQGLLAAGVVLRPFAPC